MKKSDLVEAIASKAGVNKVQAQSIVEDVFELISDGRSKGEKIDLRGFEWYYLKRLCDSALLTLKGHTLPAGVAVGISIVGLHRRPELYPDPDRFLPERFLGRDHDPFEYLPFGGGSRRCLGASFAVYEMKLVLATVLRAHALQLTDRGDLRSSLRNTTASPAKKIRMVRGSSRDRV